MFNEQKTAQIAAWFISQEGGFMPHLKLMKLMYLSERESMAKHGFPMTGDRFVAMPHGPVLSRTLDHINDAAPSEPDGWDEWISDRAGHVVGLARDVTEESLDELCKADISVLESVWKKFGWMSKYQLRDYTHDPRNCPEWVDPEGSSCSISYEQVFRALGFDQGAAGSMAAEVKAQGAIDRALSA